MIWLTKYYRRSGPQIVFANHDDDWADWLGFIGVKKVNFSKKVLVVVFVGVVLVRKKKEKK